MQSKVSASTLCFIYGNGSESSKYSPELTKEHPRRLVHYVV